MLVASCYTAEYGGCARALANSLARQKVTHLIQAIEDLGSHNRNVHQKPEVLLGVWKRFPEADPLVWIDADSVVRGSLEPLGTDSRGEVGVHRWQGRIIASTLVFKNTPRAWEVLTRWQFQNERVPWARDWQNLDRVLRLLEVPTFGIPARFAWTEPIHRADEPETEPVIEHFALGYQRKLGCGRD